MSAEFIEFFNPVAIPVLSKIPVLGPMLFNQDFFVYLALVLAVLLGIYLYRSRYGVNLIAVGENPGAADASGIHVELYNIYMLYLSACVDLEVHIGYS